MALLSGGHALVEGVPGLAKTTAIRTLAEALGLGFGRIQFTPDLLPGDLLGTPIYVPERGAFVVRRGPIFAPVLLADEINRAPAKVQSALLEAMEERQVSIGDETLPPARAVLRDGDAESGRARGHLSAARGADRPLPGEAGRALSLGGARSAQIVARDAAGPVRVAQVADAELLARAARGGRGGARRARARRLRGAPGARHARPRGRRRARSLARTARRRRRAASRSAPRRAARSIWCARRAHARCSTAATTPRRTT